MAEMRRMVVERYDSEDARWYIRILTPNRSHVTPEQKIEKI